MGLARHVEPERNVGVAAADPRPERALHHRETCSRSAVHCKATAQCRGGVGCRQTQHREDGGRSVVTQEEWGGSAQAGPCAGRRKGRPQRYDAKEAARRREVTSGPLLASTASTATSAPTRGDYARTASSPTQVLRTQFKAREPPNSV
jgi:hypothetical protein